MGFGFEDLEVYKKALDFATSAYKATKNFPSNEMYGLTSQIRRAAVSVAANIAEGSSRYHKKDFAQFLRIAKGSISECVALIEISSREGYIKRDIHDALLKDCTELAKMLSGLIRSLGV
jgi:four helix bundle protein